MRKFILVALLAFISSSALPCSGTYFAGDGPDGWNIHDDFVANCCAGSVITIINLETMRGIEIELTENGANSSCSVQMVEP